MGFWDFLRVQNPEYEQDDGSDLERCALCGVYRINDPSVAYCSMCGLSFCSNCKTNFPARVSWMMKYHMWKKKLPYG